MKNTISSQFFFKVLFKVELVYQYFFYLPLYYIYSHQDYFPQYGKVKKMPSVSKLKIQLGCTHPP